MEVIADVSKDDIKNIEKFDVSGPQKLIVTNNQTINQLSQSIQSIQKSLTQQGTTPETIDMAEDRDLFRAMMEKLEIPMPESGMAVNVEEALEIAEKNRISGNGTSFLCTWRKRNGSCS